VPTFAITEAYDAVQTWLSAKGVVASQYFGWREVARHNVTGNRVVWVPGDATLQVGDTRLPEATGTGISSGGNIAVQWQLVSIYITAPYDPADPENERDQWTRTMTLRNAIYTALATEIGQGVFRVASERYVRRETGPDARLANVTVLLVVALRDQISASDYADLTALHVTGQVELNELDATVSFPVP